MIKAVAHSNVGETLVIFGLSEGNVQELKKGRPIPIDMEELELGFKGKVVIIYGETEDALAAQFQGNVEVGQVVDLRKPETLT